MVSFLLYIILNKHLNKWDSIYEKIYTSERFCIYGPHSGCEQLIAEHLNFRLAATSSSPQKYLEID